VLEATWKVAKDICPDEIKDDNQRDSFTIVVWKSLPLDSILREFLYRLWILGVFGLLCNIDYYSVETS